MTHPLKTFELRISFDGASSKKKTKNQVMEWLSAHGIDEFVEGVMDGLDIDHEYTGPSQRDFYDELGGDSLPISIFKYSKELLDDLKAMMERRFGDDVTLSIHSMETSEWMEGWKDSFKPIESKLFYVYPPWDETSRPKDKISIVVEPGMAFGTGQHATTQVCLSKIESLALAKAPIQNWRLLDVGTGTGILAIAASKLGFKSVAASDIDPDAVTSAKNNAKLNDMSLRLWQGSVPVGGVGADPVFLPPFDVVVANILFVVLEKIIADLAKVTRPQGLLILSGVLIEDRDIMNKLAVNEGLKVVSCDELEGWACLVYTK
jgi:ribosomal protein L11 methyltransferase